MVHLGAFTEFLDCHILDAYRIRHTANFSDCFPVTGEMRGRLKDLTFGAHGEQHITITVTSDFRESYDALKDSDINVEIKKWRKPRSRDANAYFHVLVNKIAAAQSPRDDTRPVCRSSRSRLLSRLPFLLVSGNLL